MSNSNLSNPISALETNAPQKMAAQRVKAVNELCPPLFDPVGSLAFRPDQHSNSWFLSGYLETATGHKFNCLVHQLVRSAPGQPVEIASILNITDLSRLEYRSEERVHSAGEVTLATDRMQIVTPTSTIEGDHRSVHAQAEFGWGALDFTAEFPGHIMMNGGSGVFNCVDSLPTVQYSIPWGKGSGWITLDGVRHDLTGEFWFDRQWLISRGIMEEGHRALVGSSYKWVWMDLNLSNGIALGLWDIELSGERHGWVTALLQDGTHIIAALEPLADNASEFWTSAASGQRYPTRFKVNVPALDCVLEVAAVMLDQEVASPVQPKYEGVANITGTYGGKPVTGYTLIELVGDWSA